MTLRFLPASDHGWTGTEPLSFVTARTLADEPEGAAL